MTDPAVPAVGCAIPGTPLDEVQDGLDACVHCGFCLQACPTYLALEDENDSPRGRLVLMGALVSGALSPANGDVDTHISRCLGCRACETACPSGVPYGQLLEATRATLRQHHRLPLVPMVLLWTFAHPVLLRIVMFFGRVLAATPIPTLLARLPGRFGFAMAMLASTESPVERAGYTPRGDGRRGRAAVLRGCVMEGLMADTNRATERVLAQNDYAVVDAPSQRCCGALHAHAGDLRTARRLARENIAAFEPIFADATGTIGAAGTTGTTGAGTDGYVAVNAAGCGAMMKEYGHLLRDDDAWRDRAEAFSARVRDVSELLAAGGGPVIGGPLPFRVTYDAPCHLQHAQRVTREPLAVLDAIPALDRVPLCDSDQCCGSAGIYNLVEPETSDAVLAAKLSNIHATGASLVATGNPGCLMQIGAGLLRGGVAARAVHPVDLLDASYGAEFE